MNKCTICNAPISEQTRSGLCRKCSQQQATAKRAAICQERYGVDNPMHRKEFVDKIANTMLERYGVNCAMKVPKFKQKLEKTMMELYGVPYFVLSANCIDVSPDRISQTNRRFAEQLDQHYIPYELEFAVDAKQYDIHILDTNILIELNPSYTHNVIGNHWNHDGLPEGYHKEKTAVAAQHGYRVIHIWDWDNVDKIIDLVSPTTTIYARQCDVVDLAKSECDEFLDRYHIQGSTRSSEIRIGLRYRSELVAVMTFGSPRYNKNYDAELLRLCIKPQYTILGGSERLFTHSIAKLPERASVISYCDLSKFTGDVYTRLGMKLLRVNSPQEVWSKGSEKILGSSLRSLGYDKIFNTNYGKGTSNEELMIRSGWLPVYDCGQAVYVYNDSAAESACEPNSVERDYRSMMNQIQKSRTRSCKFCGKEFIPASNKQIYCKGPHIRTCPICSKEYVEPNNENLKKPPHACSYECRAAKTRKTSLRRYGCAAPGNNEEARNKAKQTMLDRYGAEYTMLSDDLKSRVQHTLLQKYGVDNPKKISKEG